VQFEFCGEYLFLCACHFFHEKLDRCALSCFHMGGETVEELTCRYYVFSDALRLYCTSPSGIKVVDGFHIVGREVHWDIPYVGKDAVECPEGAETAPFRGVLRVRNISGFKVVEALVDGRKIVAVRHKDGGVIVERIWPWSAGRAGARIVRALVQRYSLGLEEAIGIAAQIVEPDYPAEAERQIRRVLTRVDARWPEPPIAVRYSTDRSLAVSAAEDPVYGGRAFIVGVPAACRKFLIAVKGSISYGLMCAANAYSVGSAPGVAVGRQGDVYLLAEPLYISALIAEGRIECAGVGNACLDAIREAAERSLAVVGTIELSTSVRAVESEKYVAYYVECYPELLYVAPRGGGAVWLLVGSLDEVRRSVRAAVEKGAREEAVMAALSAVWLLKGYPPDLLLPATTAR